jgi:hypothetical protein
MRHWHCRTGNRHIALTSAAKNNVVQPTKDPWNTPPLSSLLHFFAETNPQFPRNGGLGRWDTTGEGAMIAKEYFVRQATILFGLAKATKDPKISAALLEKAADLKLQVDEPGAPNLTPLVPDIEPPTM